MKKTDKYSSPKVEIQQAPIKLPTWFWIGLSLLLVGRFLYIIKIPLVPDEAYYWDWTRFLSAGYFDHAPMVAWLCSVTTWLFGNTIAGVKAVSFAGFTGVALALIFFSRRIFFSVSSVVVLTFGIFALPFTGIGSLLLTPDIPLMIFWSLGLLLIPKALFTNSRPAWIGLGISIGCGLLSKYTFIMFPFSLLVFLAINPRLRHNLYNPYLWLSFGIAIALFSINIYWNWQNNWVSYRFQFSHGLGNSSSTMAIRFDYLGEFIGGQILFCAIFLFVILIIGIAKIIRSYRSRDDLLLLVVFTLVPLSLFTFSSLRNHVEANWPAMAYISGIVLIAWVWDNAIKNGEKRLKQFCIASMLFAGAMTMLLYVHILVPFLPLSSKIDITKDIRGWKDLVTQVNQLRDELDPTHTLPVAGNRYQESALLAFYLPDQPRTWSLNIGGRPNHYCLLPGYSSLRNSPLILVDPIDSKTTLTPTIANAVKSWRLLGTAVRRFNGTERVYGVFLVAW